MGRIVVVTLTALLLLFGSTGITGTIYMWTDDDGVTRFSNAEPPEDVDNLQTIEEIEEDNQNDDRQRSRAYDRMVEDASKNADRHFQQQAQRKANEAAAEQQKKLDEQAQRIESERARLQQSIDDLEGRALSRTFSAGQKAHLIKQVEEKIDQLEKSADK